MRSELSTAFSSEYSRDKPKMVRFVQFSYNVSCDDDYHIADRRVGGVIQNIFALPMLNYWHKVLCCILLNCSILQIVFKEDFGTEGRGGYFDEYG